MEFLLAFIFSFIGSIPPGTLNLTILQVGLEKKMAVAWRFALAAAIVEYPYAWIAVTFEKFILSSSTVLTNLQLITGVVMLTLGIINIIAAKSPSTFSIRFSKSGFRRGIFLSILNPLAIPYWIVITAYLESHNWIALQTPLRLHAYLLGVALGSGALLIALSYLANRMSGSFQQNTKMKLIPGAVLVVLGLYALGKTLLF